MTNTDEGNLVKQEVTQERIDYATFSKVEMQTATITEAETVAGANNLLRLIVDVGNEKRQIIAGIAKSYLPSDLIGKQVIVVTNLEPRKLRGLESNGMLLAVGETSSEISLLTLDRKIDNGLKVK